MTDTNIMTAPFVLKRPIRTLRVALRYFIPRRLTLDCNPRVHVWLWWNF